MAGFAAGVFAALVIVVMLFQFALAGGAPWGHLTLGGRNTGALPPRLRIAAVLQALVLLALGMAVLARAGLAFHAFAGPARFLVWGAVVVSGMSLTLNLTSKSIWERRIWVPVTLLMLASSLVVAATA